eukprot:4243873-Alexandrium_andersonii.AAC.1
MHVRSRAAAGWKASSRLFAALPAARPRRPSHLRSRRKPAMAVGRPTRSQAAPGCYAGARPL